MRNRRSFTIVDWIEDFGNMENTVIQTPHSKFITRTIYYLPLNIECSPLWGAFLVYDSTARRIVSNLGFLISEIK
jgi:hypothetical protein